MGHTSANPQNFRPIFTEEQLKTLLRAMFLEGPVLRGSVVMDFENLHQTIKNSYHSDPNVESGLLLAKDGSNKRWSIDSSGFLCFDSRIYVSDVADLCLELLCYYHDHPLAGHFGQNQTLHSIQKDYTFPNICAFVQDYICSCTHCGHNKAQ